MRLLEGCAMSPGLDSAFLGLTGLLVATIYSAAGISTALELVPPRKE